MTPILQAGLLPVHLFNDWNVDNPLKPDGQLPQSAYSLAALVAQPLADDQETIDLRQHKVPYSFTRSPKEHGHYSRSARGPTRPPPRLSRPAPQPRASTSIASTTAPSSFTEVNDIYDTGRVFVTCFHDATAEVERQNRVSEAALGELFNFDTCSRVPGRRKRGC